MPYKFNTCEQCSAQFRVKKYNKPFVGMYEDNPVFHWHYSCVTCGRVHTVRLYNQFVNQYFDKVRSLEFALVIHRKDKLKCQELLVELNKARDDLDLVNGEVMKVIGI